MFNELEIYKNKKIFFSGIGGVSMSSLAIILKNNGFSVFGSDRCESKNTKKLEENGIKVIIGQTKENITDDIGLVVRTAAISLQSDEMKEAISKNIPVMERCTLLGLVMKAYENRFNICGTHGKTTTTSMVALILMNAGLKPTVTVGGDFNKIGGNLLIGDMNYFVCEACEYVESFLEFFPSDTIILNIEEDHLDYYRDIEHIKSAFLKFAQKTDNLIIANGDDKNIVSIAEKLENKKVIFFGIKNGKYRAKNIIQKKNSTEFDLYCNNVFIDKITLSALGYHNVLNSLSAISLCMEKGIDISVIKSALIDFYGADRRMQYKGKTDGIEIYDDYAHHPTEIKTTIDTARQKMPKRVVLLFQPHTYTRTKAFKDDFIAVLKKADLCYVTDIYAAREKNTDNITSIVLQDKKSNVIYAGSMENATEILKKELKAGDLFITVGAGDVYKVGEKILEKSGVVIS